MSIHAPFLNALVLLCSFLVGCTSISQHGAQRLVGETTVALHALSARLANTRSGLDTYYESSLLMPALLLTGPVPRLPRTATSPQSPTPAETDPEIPLRKVRDTLTKNIEVLGRLIAIYQKFRELLESDVATDQKYVFQQIQEQDAELRKRFEEIEINPTASRQAHGREAKSSEPADACARAFGAGYKSGARSPTKLPWFVTKEKLLRIAMADLRRLLMHALYLSCQVSSEHDLVSLEYKFADHRHSLALTLISSSNSTADPNLILPSVRSLGINMAILNEHGSMTPQREKQVLLASLESVLNYRNTNLKEDLSHQEQLMQRTLAELIAQHANIERGVKVDLRLSSLYLSSILPKLLAQLVPQLLRALATDLKPN